MILKALMYFLGVLVGGIIATWLLNRFIDGGEDVSNKDLVEISNELDRLEDLVYKMDSTEFCDHLESRERLHYIEEGLREVDAKIEELERKLNGNPPV